MSISFTKFFWGPSRPAFALFSDVLTEHFLGETAKTPVHILLLESPRKLFVYVCRPGMFT